jgi:hypothetical protein
LQGAAKVSILMIGQQAIMDAYLCLLHLTAGILVGESYAMSMFAFLVVSFVQLLLLRTLCWQKGNYMYELKNTHWHQ